MEERYGNKKNDDLVTESEEDSEEDVSEDDDGELATEALDAEISATLNAIRSKDPRVYNPEVKFYQEIEEEDEEGNVVKKEKSMTLKDYHTKNLLEGTFTVDEEADAPRRTHAQELEDVRQNALQAIKAADVGSDDEEDFLVAKSKPAKKERVKKITEEDVVNAEKDPETFLSNFLASRAWVPTDGSQWKPLESDDEDAEANAEVYEDAYNRYFEEPAGHGEKIVTYARDAVASTTVRRADKSTRHKAREAARAKREAERKRREEDLARLRKLRVEEMEDKVQQIRKLGGLTGRDFKMEDWADVLEADWSDEKWDEEMQKRFGDAYYEEGDAEMAEGSDAEAKSGKKKKPKKPKFDDDIDIKDLVPDFDDDISKPNVALSSDEEDEGAEDGVEDDDVDADDLDDASERPTSKLSSKKIKQARADAKSMARRDRRLIENLVDQSLELEKTLASQAKGPAGFRYRETSPTTFGLTPADILLASDEQLNSFAGLKKLATFRDPVKKKKDKKALSKKARLRQWRLDTFGDENGPRGGFEAAAEAKGDGKDVDAKIEEWQAGDGEKKKKKRSRKKKTGESEA